MEHTPYTKMCLSYQVRILTLQGLAKLLFTCINAASELSNWRLIGAIMSNVAFKT